MPDIHQEYKNTHKSVHKKWIFTNELQWKRNLGQSVEHIETANFHILYAYIEFCLEKISCIILFREDIAYRNISTKFGNHWNETRVIISKVPHQLKKDVCHVSHLTCQKFVQCEKGSRLGIFWANDRIALAKRREERKTIGAAMTFHPILKRNLTRRTAVCQVRRRRFAGAFTSLPVHLILPILIQRASTLP